ncbi:MAG: putative exported protein [Myxococcales bacterium]|jgi:putative membrane protein|nr:putative exported protein [Myxococcales bacterium]
MTYGNLKRALLGGSLVLIPAFSVAAQASPFPPDGGADAPFLRSPKAIAQAKELPAPKENVPDPAAPRTTTPLDQATVQKLHDANQMEIQMGSLAKEKGSSKAVRDFGRQLVADHAAADRRLAEYLRRHGGDIKTLATTTSVDPDHDLLATKTGTEFDRAFALQMIADHTKAITLVESARIETADASLRELFDTLLPTLQAHKKTAQDIVVASARS